MVVGHPHQFTNLAVDPTDLNCKQNGNWFKKVHPTDVHCCWVLFLFFCLLTIRFVIYLTSKLMKVPVND